jgi:alkaline phosphatase D
LSGVSRRELLLPFSITGTDAVMYYKSFGYTQEDNFTRLDIDKAKATVIVRLFDRDGKPVLIGPENKKSPLENTLQLAKWS